MTFVSTHTYRNEYIVLVVVSARTYCSEYTVLVFVSTSYFSGDFAEVLRIGNVRSIFFSFTSVFQHLKDGIILCALSPLEK